MESTVGALLERPSHGRLDPLEGATLSEAAAATATVAGCSASPLLSSDSTPPPPVVAAAVLLLRLQATPEPGSERIDRASVAVEPDGCVCTRARARPRNRGRREREPAAASDSDGATREKKCTPSFSER